VPAVDCEVLCDPDVAFAPLHALEAVQLVALVEVQLRFAVAPRATVAGVTDRLTVGAGGGVVTVTDVEVVTLDPSRPTQLGV
jgi:hypothetical protein